MSTPISQLRARYRPEIIKVLFVAESPPESRDDEVRFFYNPDPRQERWDHLYRSVMKAVFSDEFEYRLGEKDKWLRKFQGNGYYLIDATDHPVNRLSSAKRRKEINDAVKGKLIEISRLISLSTPIILIKKSIFSAFNQPLRDARLQRHSRIFLAVPHLWASITVR